MDVFYLRRPDKRTTEAPKKNRRRARGKNDPEPTAELTDAAVMGIRVRVSGGLFTTGMGFNEGGLLLLKALHILVFGGWTISVAVAVDQPAWFQSGSLGFSFVCCAIVLVLVPIIHGTAVANLDALREEVRSVVRDKPSVAAIVKHLDGIDIPLFDRASARALLIAAAVGLVPVGWYFANALLAKTSPLLSTSTYTRALAAEMWHGSPGSTIVMLTLLSVTALVHLIDIAAAIAVLVAPTKQEENL